MDGMLEMVLVATIRSPSIIIGVSAFRSARSIRALLSTGAIPSFLKLSHNLSSPNSSGECLN